MPTVKHLVKRIRAAHEHCRCFDPADYLAVRIYPSNVENPYSLAESATYDSGVVNVTCEDGFEWDGASIPALWVLAPWLATLLLHHLATMGCIRSWCVWLVTIAMLIVTVRIAPYLQKMGRHVRAGCFHDRMYRLGKVSRVIADAIFLEMMRYDGVPMEARWLIYLNVRLFGWKPYRHWAAVRTESAKSEEISA